MFDGTLKSTAQRNFWLVGLALAPLALILVWLHYKFVVDPLDFANKDFMSLWTGATALLQGLNPYDEAVWQPLRAAYGSSWMPDPQAPFPLWTFVLMIPFALLPIRQSAAVWLGFQELLFVFSAYLILRKLERRQVGALDTGLLLLVGLTAAPTILVLINGQMTFLLLAILALFLTFLERRQPLLAGLTLALLVLKPNPFIVLAPLLGLWLIWRAQWRVIAGGLLAAAAMLLLTNAIQPGWLVQWFDVRSKTEVVTITPTLWGLAAEVAGEWWAPVGLLLVIGLLVGVARFIFARPQLQATEVVCAGIAASLLVTPYTWAYEHALLFLPWLWLFARARRGRHAQALWLLLAGIIPWLVFSLAVIRLNDSLGFIAPLVTLGAVLWTARRDP